MWEWKCYFVKFLKNVKTLKISFSCVCVWQDFVSVRVGSVAWTVLRVGEKLEKVCFLKVAKFRVPFGVFIKGHGSGVFFGLGPFWGSEIEISCPVRIPPELWVCEFRVFVSLWELWKCENIEKLKFRVFLFFECFGFFWRFVNFQFILNFEILYLIFYFFCVFNVFSRSSVLERNFFVWKYLFLSFEKLMLRGGKYFLWAWWVLEGFGIFWNILFYSWNLYFHLSQFGLSLEGLKFGSGRRVESVQFGEGRKKRRKLGGPPRTPLFLISRVFGIFWFFWKKDVEMYVYFLFPWVEKKWNFRFFWVWGAGRGVFLVPISCFFLEKKII